MYKFRKEERLCSKKQIDDLFASGNSFFMTSFKVVWKEVEVEREYPVQVLITVPKQFFKKAVKRNLLKRRMREGYRLNKYLLYKELKNNNKRINMILIYSKKEILEYQMIEKDIKIMIKQIAKKVSF